MLIVGVSEHDEGRGERERGRTCVMSCSSSTFPSQTSPNKRAIAS